VLTLDINNVAQKEEAALKSFEDVAEFKVNATPSQLLVEFGAFVSRIKRKSLIISLLLT
jgi:hypothetical protein